MPDRAVSERSEGAWSDLAGASNVAAAAHQRALELRAQGASVREALTYLTGVVEDEASPDAVASILVLDAESRLQTAAAPSLPAEYSSAINGLQASPYLGTCCAAAATGQVVLTPDIDADPQWASLKNLPLALGLVAAWSQPILGGDGRVLGTFGTYFRTCREPTEAERTLVGVLARTAAILIEDEQRTDA